MPPPEQLALPRPVTLATGLLSAVVAWAAKAAWPAMRDDRAAVEQHWHCGGDSHRPIEAHEVMQPPVCQCLCPRPDAGGLQWLQAQQGAIVAAVTPMAMLAVAKLAGGALRRATQWLRGETRHESQHARLRRELKAELRAEVMEELRWGAVALSSVASTTGVEMHQLLGLLARTPVSTPPGSQPGQGASSASVAHGAARQEL